MIGELLHSMHVTLALFVDIGHNAVVFLQDNESAAEAVGDAGNQNASIQQWELISGFAMPAIMAAINRKGWSSGTQAVAAFIAIAAFTFVKQVLGDDFDFSYWWTSALTVFTITITAFYGIYKPTGIAQKIEAATGGDSVEEQNARARPTHTH